MVKQNKPVVIWCLPSLLAQLTLQWNPAPSCFISSHSSLAPPAFLSFQSNYTSPCHGRFLVPHKVWILLSLMICPKCKLKSLSTFNNLHHLHCCSINPQALPLSNSDEEMHNAQPKPSYCSSPALSILFPPPTSLSARETLHRLLSYRL